MKKVLVIEDELDIIAIVTIILENEGYSVTSLTDAVDYESNVIKSKADLVLLDLNLAGFNGKHICSYIKNSDDLKHTPVILMSANTNIDQIMIECGADNLIRKPFDINELVATVDSYI